MFEPPAHKKPGAAVCSFNPDTGNVETGGTLASLSSQSTSSWPKESCLSGKVRLRGADKDIGCCLLSSKHMCVRPYAKTSTHRSNATPCFPVTWSLGEPLTPYRHQSILRTPPMDLQDVFSTPNVPLGASGKVISLKDYASLLLGKKGIVERFELRKRCL